MASSQSANDGIAIIICAYTEKRWDKLSAAVESVHRQTLSVSDFILVIDHNPDLYLRAQQTFTGLTVVENKETRGLSGARNTGVSLVKGNFVAFLDDDAAASPDWLALLYQHFCDEDVLGAGGASLPDWETERPGWFPEEFLWVVGCSYRGLPEKIAPVRNPMGGCTCWRMEIFTTVGNFSSSLGHVGSLPAGCEETELSIRATQHWPRRKFIFDPNAQIAHFVPVNRARFVYFCSRCYSEGISKASVTQLVGRSDGLSSERAYTLRILPSGFFRGIQDALRGDMSGLGRAGAIFAGLTITTWGYLVGCAKNRFFLNLNIISLLIYLGLLYPGFNPG